MSIKFTLCPDIATTGRYAIIAPRPGDILSGALRQAFATPGEERDFTGLLARIDRADGARA